MKNTFKTIYTSTFLVVTVMLMGCNKPVSTTSSTKTEGAEVVDVNDGDVTHKVKTALLQDESLKGFEISVVSTKGDVRLTGVVDTQAQHDQVDRLVLGIEGVHSVHDELSIKK